MSISSTRMVTLKSSDGEIFMVEESVAVVSRTIKNRVEEDRADNTILIPYVSGKILSKVIDYCRRKHLESAAAASLVDAKEIKAWEYDFVQVDKSTLRDLDDAAHFLGINSLRDLIFQTLKDMSTRIAVQETRKKTRIPNDPLELTLGKESTEEEVSELWKQYSIVNDPPKEIDLRKESPEHTKAEESDSIQKDPAVEIDLLKNFGKESTEAEEKARGKRKIIE